MKLITAVQQSTLDFIKAYRKKHKYSPSLHEVAGEFDISLNAARTRILYMEKKGMLTSTKGVPRSIVLK